MGLPPCTLFLRAIREHHLPLLTATLKSHMIYQQQGLDSTGGERRELEDVRQIVTDMTPTKHVCAAYEDKFYCFVVLGDKNENRIYSDLTG